MVWDCSTQDPVGFKIAEETRVQIVCGVWYVSKLNISHHSSDRQTISIRVYKHFSENNLQQSGIKLWPQQRLGTIWNTPYLLQLSSILSFVKLASLEYIFGVSWPQLLRISQSLAMAEFSSLGRRLRWEGNSFPCVVSLCSCGERCLKLAHRSAI